MSPSWWPVVRTVVVALAGAGLVVGASAAELPTLRLDRPGAGQPSALPPAALASTRLVDSAQLACPGPDQRGLSDSSIPEPPQAVRVWARSAPEAALPPVAPAGALGDLVIRAVPQGPPASRVGTRTATATMALTGAAAAVVEAGSGSAVGLAATQGHLGTGSGTRGLQVTGCLVPQEVSWLLAGGPEAGRTERLVLVNPGPQPVGVDLSVLGADGPVATPGASGIVVGPGGRRVVLLDALAPQEARPVVRVTATGGPVVAALGERWLDGTVDRGLELTTPAADPALDLVVPGILLPTTLGAGSVVLRVAVPGDTGAVVEVRALTPQGAVDVVHGVTAVGPGQVVDIDLTDLPPGASGLQVTADQPVVAAARVELRDRFPGAADMAWLPATEPLGELSGAPLVRFEGHRLQHDLVVSSVGGATLDVVSTTDGLTRLSQVTVPASSTRAVQLDGADSVWVRTRQGEAHAALVATAAAPDGTMVAAMPLPTAPLLRAVMSVRPAAP